MACEVGVDAVILRWGEAKRYAGRIAPAVGLIVRLSGATGLIDATGLRESDRLQAAVNTVLASVKVGADAVCVDLELGDDRETESTLRLAGSVRRRRRSAWWCLPRCTSASGPGAEHRPSPRARLGGPHRAGARRRPGQGRRTAGRRRRWRRSASWPRSRLSSGRRVRDQGGASGRRRGAAGRSGGHRVRRRDGPRAPAEMQRAVIDLVAAARRCRHLGRDAGRAQSRA